MSLTVDGFWKAGFWSETFWRNGFWFENVQCNPFWADGFWKECNAVQPPQTLQVFGIMTATLDDDLLVTLESSNYDVCR